MLNGAGLSSMGGNHMFLIASGEQLALELKFCKAGVFVPNLSGNTGSCHETNSNACS
ncbi:hypothetical protein D3C87_2151910 [compost metagenome]